MVSKTGNVYKPKGILELDFIMIGLYRLPETTRINAIYKALGLCLLVWF